MTASGCWSRRSEVSAGMLGSTISHGWQDSLKNVREFLRQTGFDENRRTSHSLRVRRNGRVDIPGEHDHGNVSQRGIASEFVDQFPTAVATADELKVSDYGVRMFLLELA
jgi:hypothetical protein